MLGYVVSSIIHTKTDLKTYVASLLVHSGAFGGLELWWPPPCLRVIWQIGRNFRLGPRPFGKPSRHITSFDKILIMRCLVEIPGKRSNIPWPHRIRWPIMLACIATGPAEHGQRWQNGTHLGYSFEQTADCDQYQRREYQYYVVAGWQYHCGGQQRRSYHIHRYTHPQNPCRATIPFWGQWNLVE